MDEHLAVPCQERIWRDGTARVGALHGQRGIQYSEGLKLGLIQAILAGGGVDLPIYIGWDSS